MEAIITRFASVNYLRLAKALITPIGALITNTLCLRYGKEHTKIAKQLNISNTTLSFRIPTSEFRIYIKRVYLDEEQIKTLQAVLV